MTALPLEPKVKPEFRLRGTDSWEMIWTREMITAVKRLWDAGKPTAAISRQLSASWAVDVSKNMVIGIAHRNGFTARPASVSRKPSRPHE
jgi:hypothetical protein